MKLAKLALEDGTVFTGRSFGADGERSGEVVFNTAMSGYQEVLTDPSYKGQIVTMTYPHIGNYGVNDEDWESGKVWVEGFVAREFSRVVSNFRSNAGLDDYFRDHGIVADRRHRHAGAHAEAEAHRVDERRAVDGRARRREAGREGEGDPEDERPRPGEVRHLGQAAPLEGLRHPRPQRQEPGMKYKVAVVDCGVKFNIIRSLVHMGCDVTVFPANVPAKELEKFDGVCLSNGRATPRRSRTRSRP
jgi:carbamoyl-phosphate synthase small subunit